MVCAGVFCGFSVGLCGAGLAGAREESTRRKEGRKEQEGEGAREEGDGGRKERGGRRIAAGTRQRGDGDVIAVCSFPSSLLRI